MTAADTLPLELPRDAVLPDYGPGGLFALVGKIRAFLAGTGWPPPDALGACGFSDPSTGSAPGSAPVLVLLLVDGLGDHFLQRHGAGSRLLEHRQTRLTSVFPSTTASAVTTLLTGLAPAGHGLTGWFIRDQRFGGTLAPLPMRMRGAGPIEGRFALRRLFPYRSLFQSGRRASVLISPASIAHSRFSLRHARGARIQPYEGLCEMSTAVEFEVRALKASGGGYVHAYYPELDAISHESGCTSEPALAEFGRIEAAVATLVARLSGSGAQIVITADHGFIDSDPGHTLHLEAMPGLATMLEAPLSGEARSAFCEVRTGAETDFLAFAHSELAGKAVAVPSSRLLAHGLFGPGKRHPRLRERIGSHTLLMEPGWTIRDRVPGEREHPMLGVHGGLSADEMWVPLITIDC